MPAGRLVVGVDVGATKIAAGIADERGRAITSRRVHTAPAGGRHVVDQITGLVEALVSEDATGEGRVAAIGIAVPAVIDRSKGAVLWAPNIAGWQQELEVARPVSKALGFPVSLHYDGHAWVVGEWWCGAARGAKDVALIAVGTGIGGGLMLGGRLHTGRVGVAGAIGWWVMAQQHADSGGKMEARNLEALASGPAIAAAAGMDAAPEVFAAARDGHPQAREAVDQAAEALGSAVANLVSLIDPEIVVLGGGVIDGAADLLLPRIQHLVGEKAQPQVSRSVRVVASQLGEDAAWLGAGRLALGPIDRE